MLGVPQKEMIGGLALDFTEIVYRDIQINIDRPALVLPDLYQGVSRLLGLDDTQMYRDGTTVFNAMPPSEADTPRAMPG